MKGLEMYTLKTSENRNEEMLEQHSNIRPDLQTSNIPNNQSINGVYALDEC